MRSDRRWTIGAALALAVGGIRPPDVRGDDGAPAPAKPADAERKSHAARAMRLGAESGKLYRAGEFAKAVSAAREALAEAEEALGKDHADLANFVINLGMMLLETGAHDEAQENLRRALAIKERTVGKDDPEVANVLNLLAVSLTHRGDRTEARGAFERAVAIWERARGPDDPNVAICLSGLGMLLSAEGDLAEARRVLERALAIREKALGPTHVEVAQSLHNLADVLKDQGEYALARSRSERAVAIVEKSLPPHHPFVAASLNGLAQVLVDLGDYAAARRPLERALSIREKALGSMSPSVATSLNNLATFFLHQGSREDARPLLERALAINERAFGKTHPEVALSLRNLAVLLMDSGAHRDAKPLLERALAIDEAASGGDATRLASDLEILASLLTTEGDFPAARRHLERAVAIREKSRGPDHPHLAVTLGHLATVLRRQGALDRAVPLLERALAIREKALGPDHPLVAVSLGSLASGLWAQGALTSARPVLERMLGVVESNARARVSALNTRQRLALLRTTRYSLDGWIRFAPLVGLSAYPAVLRIRGLVSRAEAGERAVARRATGDERRTQDALRAAQRRAARLANEYPASDDAKALAAWQRAYAEASAERERLTLDLAKQSAPLRVTLERLDLTLPDIQRQLEPGAVLVDFLRGADRYLAWIVRVTGEPIHVDLGPVDAVERECVAFVSAVTKDLDVASTGAVLRARIWDPIAAKLDDGVRHVVICPDAALAAVPFAALPGKDAGRYLLDDLAISYVMNAQDLVPRKEAPKPGAGALLVGGIDYDRAAPGTGGPSASGARAGAPSSDRAPLGGSFPPIRETRIEVERLRARFGDEATTLLLGSDATEARLREAVQGKRVVHVATHGFAREDLLSGLYSRDPERAWASADAERQLAVGHDPMLLSGLAMAGANPRDGAAGDDGILTALEASDLDLDGVDLVTLSACETARGTAESGEGVQGLVSAFQMAGARRVIASLWRVDDEGTRRLMDGLYAGLLRQESPLSPADALRASALALRSSKDADGTFPYAAPRDWAAFVAYGR